MAQYALEQRFAAGADQAEVNKAPPEPRWPVRRRFVFILVAATLCWVVPAVLAYLLITR